jgi:hypothetical protein
MTYVNRSQAKELIGKQIYAVRRDGSLVQGILTDVNGNELIIKPSDGKVRTKAFIPLVLFDLLAIGTAPFYGGYGYGGFYGYDGFW